MSLLAPRPTAPPISMTLPSRRLETRHHHPLRPGLALVRRRHRCLSQQVQASCSWAAGGSVGLLGGKQERAGMEAWRYRHLGADRVRRVRTTGKKRLLMRLFASCFRFDSLKNTRGPTRLRAQARGTRRTIICQDRLGTNTYRKVENQECGVSQEAVLASDLG
jgi:hypothetical protein